MQSGEQWTSIKKFENMRANTVHMMRPALKSFAGFGLLIGSLLMAYAVYLLSIGAYEAYILNDTVDYIILAVLVAIVGNLITAVSTLIFRWTCFRRAN